MWAASPFPGVARGHRCRLCSCRIIRLVVEFFLVVLVCTSNPSTHVFVLQRGRFSSGCFSASFVTSPADALPLVCSFLADALLLVFLVIAKRILCCYSLLVALRGCSAFIADILPLTMCSLFSGGYLATVVSSLADTLPLLLYWLLWQMLCRQCCLVLSLLDTLPPVLLEVPRRHCSFTALQSTIALIVFL